MVTISPVLEKDISNATKEFLRDDMRNSRFGGGNFVVFNSNGSVTPTISITHPQADNLFHGKTIDGAILVSSNPNDIAAWQISFKASPSLNLLYAITSQRISSNIRTAHARASLEILNELASCVLNVKSHRGFLGMQLDDRRNSAPRFSWEANETVNERVTTGEEMHCSMVVFHSEVSQDKSPNLNITVFLLNRIRLQDGQVQTLVNDKAMDRIRLPLYESYAGALDYFTEKAIGEFHRTANVRELRIEGIPQLVVQNFFWKPPLDSQMFNQADNDILSQKELFAKWRSQATALGWGPKEATALLRQIRRDQYWNNIKEKCTYIVAHPGRTLREATASLSRLIIPEKNIQQKTAEKSSEKDKHQSQYRSR